MIMMRAGRPAVLQDAPSDDHTIWKSPVVQRWPSVAMSVVPLAKTAALPLSRSVPL
jgi:hypothetical protein